MPLPHFRSRGLDHSGGHPRSGTRLLPVRMDLAQPDATSHLLNQCLTLTGFCTAMHRQQCLDFRSRRCLHCKYTGAARPFPDKYRNPPAAGQCTLCVATNATLNWQWTLQRDPCARPKSTQHQPRLFFVHRQQMFWLGTQHRPAGPSLGAFGAGMRAHPVWFILAARRRRTTLIAPAKSIC